MTSPDPDTTDADSTSSHGLSALVAQVAGMRSDLDALVPHVAAQVRRDRGHDELVARLGRAERALEAKRTWPLVVAVHTALNEVRSYVEADRGVVTAIESALLMVLNQAGFIEFGAVGDAFDPDRHDPVVGRTYEGRGTLSEVRAPGLCFDNVIVTRAQVGLQPVTADTSDRGQGA